MRRERFGDFEAVEGGLSKDDARAAYVVAPLANGRRAAIASFWFYGEARAYAVHRANGGTRDEWNRGLRKTGEHR